MERKITVIVLHLLYLYVSKEIEGEFYFHSIYINYLLKKTGCVGWYK